MAMSGDVFACHSSGKGRSGHLVGRRARDAYHLLTELSSIGVNRQAQLFG